MRSSLLCHHLSPFDHQEACFSSRDYQVLKTFATYKYLTSRHVERLHFNSLNSLTSNNRACRRVLARLVSHGLLHCLKRRIGGTFAGSTATIYHLSSAGDKLLQNMGLIEHHTFRKVSDTFLDHTLSIAEAAVLLTELARSETLELMRLSTEPTCWRTFLGMYGTAEYLKPDLHAITATSEYESHFFVEIDLGTESLPRIVKKCKQYTAYWRSGVEQEATAIFPYVVWVAPNKTRAARMAQAINHTSGLRHELFSVITPSDFLSVMQSGPLSE